MYSRSIVRACAAALALMALVLGAGIAQAAPATPLCGTAPGAPMIIGPVHCITSPQVYQTPNAQFFDVTHLPLHLIAPSYYVVDSQFVSGHYEYAYDLHAPHGSVVAAIEVAIDPVAHTELIEVGVPTADSSTAPQAPATGGSSATSETAGMARGNAVSPLFSPRSTSGFYRTVWSGSLGIEANEVKDTINFSYDGTYVDSFNGSDYRAWSGAWGEQSHSIGTYYSNNNTRGTVWTYDHFYSGSYCWPLGGSDVYYSDNNVYGFGAGDVGGHVSTWQDGNCSWSLSYYTQVGGGGA